jgi:hypothetical protein
MRSGVCSLPVDLLRVIRDFLFTNERENSVTNIEESPWIIRMLPQESQWSWRNFLSTSNSKDWRYVRKNLMIWSLNALESVKYFADETFRFHLTQRRCIPEQQLGCRLSFMEIEVSRIINTDKIGSLELNLRGQSVTALPTMFRLHTLHVSWGGCLNEIGNYPNLRFLRLHYCSELSLVGETTNLSVLHFIGFSYGSLFQKFYLRKSARIKLFLRNWSSITFTTSIEKFGFVVHL